MKAFHLLLVGLFISASCLVARADATLTNRVGKLKDANHTAWVQVTNSIANTSSRFPTKWAGKKATYQYAAGPSGTSTMPVTVFVSPHLQKPWIGPEQDFYVELDSGVIGGRLAAGMVIWCESLVSMPNTGSTNVSEIIRQFENNIDTLALMEAGDGGVSEAVRRSRITVLLRIFSDGAFANGRGSSQASEVSRIAAVEMDGGDLKLTIENSPSKFEGVAWINPQTRKVTKATEGSKPIFPR